MHILSENPQYIINHLFNNNYIYDKTYLLYIMRIL